MRKSLKNILFFLFSITPLIFSPSLSDDFHLPKYCWIFFLTLILIFLFLSRRERKFKKKEFLIPLLILLFWQFFTSYVSVNIFESINKILHFLLFIVFYFLVVEIMEKEDIYRLFNCIVWISVLISIYGFFQIAGYDFISWSIKRSPLSTLGRRNFAAEYL